MQSEENIETIDQQSPALEALEQVEIPFLNHLLLALQGVDGEIYVPVTLFAQHLGLAQPRHQVTRIRRDETMEEALRTMIIKTAGGMQETQCLRIGMLTLWLATIRAAMVKEEIRPTLRQYKREAARAILAYFSAKVQARALTAISPHQERLPMPSPSAAPDEWISYYEGMAALYRTVQNQNTIIAVHEQRLDRHEDEIAALSEGFVGIKEALAIIGETPEPRISIHQQNQIQALVSKIHEATSIHQGTIFAAFKKHWQLPRYDELPAAQFDAAYEWLRQWGRARLTKQPTTGKLSLLSEDVEQ